MHAGWICTHPLQLNFPSAVQATGSLQTRAFRLQLRSNTKSLPRGSFCEQSRLASESKQLGLARADVHVCTPPAPELRHRRASVFLLVLAGTHRGLFCNRLHRRRLEKPVRRRKQSHVLTNESC